MRKILIVGDSAESLKTLKNLLENDEIRITEAQITDEPLTALGKQTFDCILLTFQTSHSAVELCRPLKAIESLGQIPIIFLCPTCTDEDLLLALEAGAFDSVPMNSDIRVIIAKIHAAFRFLDVQKESATLRNLRSIKKVMDSFHHDFNNPFTVAMGNIHWLKANCRDEQLLDRIARLGQALDRMSQITRKIRDLRDQVESQ